MNKSKILSLLVAYGVYGTYGTYGEIKEKTTKKKEKGKENICGACDRKFHIKKQEESVLYCRACIRKIKRR